MQFFSVIEFTLFIAALLVSVYVAVKEGFARKNIILISILLFVNITNSFHMFPVLNTDWMVRNDCAIKNVSLLIEVALYLLLYSFLLEKRRYRLFLIWYLLSFLTFSWLDVTNLQRISTEYLTYAFVFGSFGVLIGILLFFREKLIQSGGENIFKNFWFWISAGLFIFLATEIPIMSLLNYLVEKKQDSDLIDQATLVMSTKRIISLFYYLMYIVGLLCRIKT